MDRSKKARESKGKLRERIESMSKSVKSILNQAGQYYNILELMDHDKTRFLDLGKNRIDMEDILRKAVELSDLISTYEIPRFPKLRSRPRD